MSPRRTAEFNAVLRLKVRNAGKRNRSYTAELFVHRGDKDAIQDLVLVTGLDAVIIRDIRDKEPGRWDQKKRL